MTAETSPLPPKARDKSDIRLVSRLADVLRVLSETPTGLSLGGIAKASGIPRGTVQRLIDAMEIEGLVARGAADSSIRLGQEIARLGMTMNRDVTQFFRPILQDLRDACCETVALSIRHPRGVAVLDQIASPLALRVVAGPGHILPLHATALGKAHLAQLSPAERHALLPGPLPALTRQTRTDPLQLLAEIAAQPADQPFEDREEFAEGICALGIDLSAAALGPVALSITMPAARFAEAAPRCAELLIALRRRLGPGALRAAE